MARKGLSFVLFGEQSLLVQCAELLRERGHAIAAIFTEDPRIAGWARGAGIAVTPTHSAGMRPPDLGEFDYLITITNLHLLPDWLLQAPRCGAVNFHDGPATHNLGRNAPVWAIINGDATHGITWHLLKPGRDAGRVLLTREFSIGDSDNAFALNSQCYEAGLDSFPALADLLEASLLAGTADFDQRPYMSQRERPDAGAVLDWREPATQLSRLVRGLDFAHVPNPVLLPKLDSGSELFLVRRATAVAAGAQQQPGEIQSLGTSVSVRCGEGALQILHATTLNGDTVDLSQRLAAAGLRVGSTLPAGVSRAVSSTLDAAAPHEIWLQHRLQAFEPSALPFAQRAKSGGRIWLPLGKRSIAALLLLIARLNRESRVAVACMPCSLTSLAKPGRRHLAGPLPLIVELDAADRAATWARKVDAGLSRLEQAVGMLADLPARTPAVRMQLDAVRRAPVRVVRWEQLPVSDAAAEVGLAVHVDASGDCAIQFDERQIPATAITRLVDAWDTLEQTLLDSDAMCRTASLLSAAERQALDAMNHQLLAAPVVGQRIHEQFEAQVRKTPEHKACTFEGRSLSYRELNSAANQLARRLQALSVGRGTLVGVHVPRSLEMLVALLACHKAGAAYLPLDPTYPPDRLAYMVSDAGVSVVLSRSDVASLDVPHDLKLDRMQGELAVLPDGNLDVQGEESDLAYVMYTSGSTGKPKGVMVEHRNVANFFAGVDERFGTKPGVWLAITSISFDISVLELFWTLARGFTVVLHGDALRQKGRAAPQEARPAAAASGTARQPMSFGLFYWNVAKDDSDHAPDKYRLLLESARFADAHGFAAVWTPERHFESFGGLFPNPSVTSAALATITRNVQLRAGSCVVPLHSPIRIAEEWAVVDNLSNGRVGISVASGWAAPDFAIKPENFADSKQIMFESLDIIRRLWRGDAVELPGPRGTVAVRTLPRPIQKELPVWVTTAGNIDTFIQAGKLGANLLTHLLSQTVDETAVKIAAYRRAWREAGHPGRGVVSLMLHTFVGPDRAMVEAIVRQPLKEYLRSAVALLKAAAWQSPTFRKFSEAEGKSLDDFFTTVSDEDMDQLLEFAFQRYFNDSGLFGSPRDCREIVERTAAADVDEIACLIDFGIDADKVLEHLPYLDQVREQAQQGAARDNSIASLLTSEGVTHFQCTPTMASLLASDIDAQPGLAALQQMMVGGEALAPDLARTLSALVKGRVSNMYGPTETTIWSTSAWLGDDQMTPAGAVTIGSPLRNQLVHVMDDCQQRLPQGLPGELVIGGLGVTRGYWQRPDLTAERFLADTESSGRSGSRMYRTGDLGRWLPDGRLEFLGRSDQQVKIHGYRIELGEIEALLREDAQVREAVVVLREDSPGDRRLVGYVQPVSGATVDTAGLRQALASALPDFMLPSVIVSMPDLPQTPNGKIDRKALPAPARRESAAPIARILPAAQPDNGLESLVGDVWRRVLGVGEIGLRDNFFDIGGHSLLIIQVLKELREKVPRPIQMTDLFRHTTIETLARFLDGGDASSESASQRGRSRAEARRAAATRSP